MLGTILSKFNTAVWKRNERSNTRIETAVTEFVRPQTINKTTMKAQTSRTKADRGLAMNPDLIEARNPLDHMRNAFIEFLAITNETKVTNETTCKNILFSYHLENKELLKTRLKEAEAAIYNNETSEFLSGCEKGYHMAAYNSTAGFVALDENETKCNGVEKFETPPNDPIVVIARCTRVMLEDRILTMANKVKEEAYGPWKQPKITWVNGVPGCGKTTWIIDNFHVERDLIVTTTTEAANDLKEKLALRIGIDAKTKVRTMASLLVNGLRAADRKRCNRLMVDEALMNHFGAIVMAIRISGTNEALLIGDVNQLPYIERNNLFKLQYTRPNSIAIISKELLCTHRNPMDVAYALREIYSGIYSSKSRTRSMELKGYTGAQIPKNLARTLYMTHTQAEKSYLLGEGYASGTGSRILTIHEAQGLTYETVVIVRTIETKTQLQDSISHAVVAVSRHTENCTYYTDDRSDAIAHFMKQAEAASNQQIRDYNLQMAIHHRDLKVIDSILKS